MSIFLHSSLPLPTLGQIKVNLKHQFNRRIPWDWETQPFPPAPVPNCPQGLAPVRGETVRERRAGAGSHQICLVTSPFILRPPTPAVLCKQDGEEGWYLGLAREIWVQRSKSLRLKSSKILWLLTPTESNEPN
ncbi:hypothetical protein KIL84_022228 [Mauremys mutica]|uniref:Uncharacterized protein n=1 Tax=Mauremys mutica TaxID=74926 RepID=A0A9D3XA98_9SAUR|nr:hypothetical protein KIL84_022228 [Mauremys mutica]